MATVSLSMAADPNVANGDIPSKIHAVGRAPCAQRSQPAVKLAAVSDA
jgi:hypothetical protein